MRRFLKGDEGMSQAVAYHIKTNPTDVAKINFMSSINGMTLYDAVSYERKHNENNGEDNRDGTDYNYSWNCGFEGETRRKAIRALRLQQIRNAFAFVLFSQGVPMILAGDEMLNSQDGNNNAYCQDNETGWVKWSKTKDSKELFEYVNELINYRSEERRVGKEC